MVSTAAAFSPRSAYGATHDTTLSGSRLWIARALWVILFAVSLLVYAAQVPLSLRALTYDWQVERSGIFLGLNPFNQAYDTYVLFVLFLSYAVLLTFIGVALYTAGRKSNDWMALFVSATLIVLPQSFNAGGYIDNWSFYRTPLNHMLTWLEGTLSVLGVILLVLFFFLFPDGRFVPRWTRWIALPISFALALIWLSTLLPVETEWEGGWYLLMGLFFFAMVIGVGAQLYRYRRVQDRVQKQQTRWVVLGLIAVVIGFLTAFSLMSLETYTSAFLTMYLSIAIPLIIPITVALAMTRDRLWEADPLFNRALLYGALTGILILVYVLTVAALSLLFRLTNNFIIAAIATGIVALLFQPLRERLQHTINRMLYGERDDPLKVLYELGAQLEGTLTPDAALPLIVGTIGQTLHVPYAAVDVATERTAEPTARSETSLSLPGSAQDRTTIAEFGVKSSDCIRIPFRYQNETVGDLVVARHRPGQAFTPPDLQLLENLARQAGAMAYTARLNADLKNSRERVILEREQERRRLRRDLHDGLGPTLASQTLKLDAAIDLLNGKDSDTASVRRILQELKAQSQATVADIRRIVYELRPPALDDLGLVGALRAHLSPIGSTSRIEIVFDAPAGSPPLSAAVQVNAYRIVIEAVSNIVRHANATECRVRMAEEDGNLVIEITDNGQGFDHSTQRGVGINAMRERAEEVGGTFELESKSGHGTRVMVKLPVQN